MLSTLRGRAVVAADAELWLIEYSMEFPETLVAFSASLPMRQSSPGFGDCQTEPSWLLTPSSGGLNTAWSFLRRWWLSLDLISRCAHADIVTGFKQIIQLDLLDEIHKRFNLPAANRNTPRQ